jgi:uncharacterized protein YhbP (UPF0306 family)
MPVQGIHKPISAVRLERIARRLLSASPLCAISTVATDGRAHVNTAYFAYGGDFLVIWLSAPEARHSRNIRRDPSVAIAVYDSKQKWGGYDRGIQLFGAARETSSRAEREAERLYARRFKAYAPGELKAYRFYRFRPRTLKLFHERELGGATFVTAKVGRRGSLTWQRTESYVGTG